MHTHTHIYITWAAHVDTWQSGVQLTIHQKRSRQEALPGQQEAVLQPIQCLKWFHNPVLLACYICVWLELTVVGFLGNRRVGLARCAYLRSQSWL